MRLNRFSLCCTIGSLWAASAFATMQSEPPGVAARMGLKPGYWHTTIRITGITVIPQSGKVVPPNMEAELGKKIGSSLETDDCIGPAQNPRDDLILPGIRIAADCAYREVEVNRHRLNLIASCGSVSKGFKADIAVQAKHTDVAMEAEMETTAFSAGAGLSTKINLTTSSVYRGKCPAR